MMSSRCLTSSASLRTSGSLPYSRTTFATSPAPWWPGDRVAHENDAGLGRDFDHQALCMPSLVASKALVEEVPETGVEWSDMS